MCLHVRPLLQAPRLLMVVERCKSVKGSMSGGIRCLLECLKGPRSTTSLGGQLYTTEYGVSSSTMSGTGMICKVCQT